MPGIALTDPLRGEYQRLFDTCQVKADRAAQVDTAARALLRNRARYEDVADDIEMPWQVVAAIHNMESSQRFNCHLHNGDPLTARTIHVPSGRPVDGEPPFTWEASAIDALQRFRDWHEWSIVGVLYCLERYNGWGYRSQHPEVKTPYLWSFSNHYTSGKYVADGRWSPTAVSSQCGAATILRRLAELGEFETSDHVDDREAVRFADSALKYAPNTSTEGGAELQRFLNRFPGIYLREDGRLGPRTSAAYQSVFGRYLRGDPRERPR